MPYFLNQIFSHRAKIPKPGVLSAGQQFRFLRISRIATDVITSVFMFRPNFLFLLGLWLRFNRKVDFYWKNVHQNTHKQDRLKMLMKTGFNVCGNGWCRGWCTNLSFLRETWGKTISASKTINWTLNFVELCQLMITLLRSEKFYMLKNNTIISPKQKRTIITEI